MPNTPDDPVERAARHVIEPADFSAMGVFEKDGKLYWPTTIKTRNVDGTVGEHAQVLLTLVEVRQRYRARSMARTTGAKFKLDPDRDAAEFEELEHFELLAFAIRDPQTRGQLEENAEALFTRFTDASLKEVWARYLMWTDVMDPRFGDLSTEQLWLVIARVAAEGNASPLVAMPGYEQATCIVFMARAARDSLSAPSWLSSPPRSASRPSAEKTSSESSTESPPGKVTDEPA